MNLISLFTTSILTQNIVLTKFLGICPFVGTSSKEKSAIGMGIAVSIVITLSSLITYLLYHYLLIPTQTEYLMTIMFILVIAVLVQSLEMIIKKVSPTLYKSLGIYLPLITTNCAVLGITLLNVNQNYTLTETLVFSLGSSIGFTFVIYLFASIREYMEQKPIPENFKGYSVAFITAAIMSILFGRYMIG